MTSKRPPVAGVRLARNGPVVFVEAGDIELKHGDEVLVELADGEEVSATVAVAPDQLLNTSAMPLIGQVTRHSSAG